MAPNTRRSAAAVSGSSRGAAVARLRSASKQKNKPTTKLSARGRSAANPPPPEDDDDDDDDDDLGGYHPAQALSPLPGGKKASATIVALQDMPALCCLNQHPLQQAINTDRIANREALLAQCVGSVSAQQCRLCAKYKGL
jgi:hypothetical protein